MEDSVGICVEVVEVGFDFIMGVVVAHGEKDENEGKEGCEEG